MTSDATQAKWVRVLLAGVAPHILSGAVLTGTHSPGAQGLLVLALLALLAGAIVVRTVDPTIDAPHGVLVGLVAGLVGLRPNYIAAQLTRWRVGERTAAEPDCMKRIATRITDSDIHAVAAWLARQKPPRDSSPESSNLVRMPLACGSQR